MELKKSEIKLIVEALSFASCCDIEANWDENKQEKQAKLALKLAEENKIKKSDLKGINIYQGAMYVQPEIVEILEKIVRKETS